jgi:hypothetical protein
MKPSSRPLVSSVTCTLWSLVMLRHNRTDTFMSSLVELSEVVKGSALVSCLCARKERKIDPRVDATSDQLN